MKLCTSCGKEPRLSYAYVCRGCKNADARVYYAKNRARLISKVGKWKQANRERAKAYYRRKGKATRYGLSPEQLAALGKTCCICKEDLTKVYVDHDHVTGKVRGALCHGCNSGLGFFKDSPERLMAAATYVGFRKV